MEKSLQKELFNLIKQGGFTVNHGKGGVRGNSCSLSIPSFNVIVKGQCENYDDSKNAVLSFFRANTEELLGKSLGCCLFVVEVVLLNQSSSNFCISSLSFFLFFSISKLS
jgi:hypothetical protein